MSVFIQYNVFQLILTIVTLVKLRQCAPWWWCFASKHV